MPTTKFDWHRIVINLTPEQFEALKSLAYERRTQVAVLIREAVDKWLEGQQRRREKLQVVERSSRTGGVS